MLKKNSRWKKSNLIISGVKLHEFKEKSKSTCISRQSYQPQIYKSHRFGLLTFENCKRSSQRESSRCAKSGLYEANSSSTKKITKRKSENTDTIVTFIVVNVVAVVTIVPTVPTVIEARSIVIIIENSVQIDVVSVVAVMVMIVVTVVVVVIVAVIAVVNVVVVVIVAVVAVVLVIIVSAYPFVSQLVNTQLVISQLVNSASASTSTSQSTLLRMSSYLPEITLYPYKLIFYLMGTIFVYKISLLSFHLHLSVESIAKAPSSLRSPSIIISKVCHLKTSFTLGHSCLYFSNMESRFTLDIQRIPTKGYNKYYSIFCKRNKFRRRVESKFIVLKLVHSINKSTEYSNKCIKNKILFTILLRSGDIERNPGPINLKLVSQNCRGLKNKDKLKQLLFRSNKLYSEDTKIIALQETHLESTFIKYSWTGKVAVTPSVGAKGGVITLLSGNINVRDQFDIDNECHVLLTEITSNRNLVTVIVVNLHSPCSHDGSKLTFFKKIRDRIDELVENHDNCEIVIMGDFNTTFWPSERINTTRSKREIEVAIKIKEIFEDLDIIDCWGQHDNTMTWKHGNKMSRIDRIQWTRNLGQTLTHNVGVDWTITSSDHAAVIVELKPQRIEHNRSVITRIDTTFMSNDQNCGR